MTADTRNLIPILVSMMSTLLVATLGLYYTAKARSASLRQLLYAKQFELAQRIVRGFGRARIFCILLMPDSGHVAEARSDLTLVMKRPSILSDEAAVVFPTDLYSTIRESTNALSAVLSEYDNGIDISASVQRFKGQHVKAALMLRVLLGVDELSSESVKLFSKERDLESIGSMHPDELISQARS